MPIRTSGMTPVSVTAFDRLRQLLDLFRHQPGAGNEAVRRQATAIILRHGIDGSEILMVTSDHGRWILPKGWVERGEDGAAAACREAYEEAGIRARQCEGPVCRYGYTKKRPRKGDIDCVADAYLLSGITEEENWPERNKRQRRWVPVQEAFAIIDEDGLRQAIETALRLQRAA